ncbi:MAG: hypothetical protein JW821_13600 [Deltaproteobacteria bacterium]|nr:hypothetical protein [Deltaproteobacteria bacterium]
MDLVEDYFACKNCNNRDFKRVYNFFMRFRGVNFSDELMYDRVKDEKYKCTNCGEIYTIEQIEETLGRIKRMRREKA